MINQTLRILIGVNVRGKLESSYLDKQGNPKPSYSITYEQNEGLVNGTLKVTKEVYALLERGKDYLLDAEYIEGKYGNYIKVIGINNNLGK